MKLYACRDKTTKEPVYFGIVPKEGPPATEIENHEIVVFREEPTKPCEWCSGEHKVEGGFTLDYGYFLDFLSAENRRFCPNCGRRLTDD